MLKQMITDAENDKIEIDHYAIDITEEKVEVVFKYL